MAFGTIIKTAICLVLPIAVAFGAAPLSSPSYKIGVIQTIEHPALDETRQGILDELMEGGFKGNLQWTWESAQMNQVLGTQIAQKFVGQPVDLIVAIGTLAAQTALSVARNSRIPIVFASVTDPKSAKLVEGNISGVSNFIPVAFSLGVISEMIPNQKRLGIIYNSGDANSVTLVRQMQEFAPQKGLKLEMVTLTKTSEASGAAQSLIGKVDAIFINNDNTALAAINGIGQVCRDNNIPLFSSDGDLKESGALALLGADQYEVGRQTGRMAAKVLRGEAKAADLPIEYPPQGNMQVNADIAQTLGIALPEPLKTKPLEATGGKS